MSDSKAVILSELTDSILALDQEQLDRLSDLILSSGRVFCDGLGRSALAMRGFSMRLMQMGRESSLVGEATAPALQAGDLLLLCSASGISQTLISHGKCAKELGGRVALLTASAHSPLAQMADCLVRIHAPGKNVGTQPVPQNSIQPMGSLFEQTAGIVCDILTLDLMEKIPVSAEEMRRRHANLE